MIIDGIPGRRCGKVVYYPSLRSGDRLQFHEFIVASLDELGEKGLLLGDALDVVFRELKSRGIAVETVNLEPRKGQ